MKMPVKKLLTVGFAAVCGLVVTAIVTGPADAVRRRAPPPPGVFTCEFEQPSDGDLLLFDDDFVDITGLMPAGSDFVFFGVPYGPPAPADAEIDLSAALPAQASVAAIGGIFVGSNGFITFGAGPSGPFADFSESFAEFIANEPRIAALWDDLSPNVGGAVKAEFRSSPDRLVVTWVGVPEFCCDGSNTFQVILFLATDRLEILYEGLTALLAVSVVGISPGAGGDAIGEEFFGEDDFDLDGRCLGGKNIGGGAMSLELIP